MRSRVIPGSSPTIDRRLPVIRLNSVLLPTLGRPTIATSGNDAAPALTGTTDLRYVGKALLQLGLPPRLVTEALFVVRFRGAPLPAAKSEQPFSILWVATARSFLSSDRARPIYTTYFEFPVRRLPHAQVCHRTRDSRLWHSHSGTAPGH